MGSVRRPRTPPRPVLLVVTAVDAEAEAVLDGLGGSPDRGRIGPYPTRERGGCLLVTAGVGPAAAAAATAAVLTARPGVRGAVSLGIAGGYGVGIGSVVVASEILFADLGAHSPEGWLGAAELGWPGAAAVAVPGAERLADALGAVCGPVLTVSAATGTAERAAVLAERHAPLAEAMEGAGVATAAVRFGVPVAEVRAVSNAAGRRDRDRWDIPAALAALRTLAPRLAASWP